MDFLGIMIVIIVLFLLVSIFFPFYSYSPTSEDLKKIAGRDGEKFVAELIREILYEDDVLMRNIPLQADGKRTELDNVVVNKTGVFIIEVKNLRGELSGDEDSYDWIQIKSSPSGDHYQKTVKNPIKQVRRQIYILSKFLKDHGIDVWINGYVFFTEGNCPVESSYLLKTPEDIDREIHSKTGIELSEKSVERILELLH